MENWINQNIITMNFKISYAITACNEHKELNELLEFLLGHKRDEDEVVVQTDSDSSTKEVSKVISSHNLKEIPPKQRLLILQEQFKKTLLWRLHLPNRRGRIALRGNSVQSSQNTRIKPRH